MPCRFWKSGGSAVKPTRSVILDATYTPALPATPPVLARTSTAGAAPLTWSTTLNYSNTDPGDLLRVQVASDSGFSTITQEILHQLTPSEMEAQDINVTFDGFLTPSGLYYLRMRVESDEGGISGWSNVLTDTITAASTLLTTTDGVNKSQYEIVSGSPLLAFTGTSGLGSSSFVRASANSAQAKYGFDLAYAGTGALHTGVDSNTTAIGPGIGVLPTINTLSSNGVLVNVYSSGFDIYSGGSAVQSGGTGFTAGDRLIVEVDKGTGVNGTVAFFRLRSGTKLQLGTTVTGLAAGNLVRAIFGTFENGANGTANFGQSALNLNTGFNPYG